MNRLTAAFLAAIAIVAAAPALAVEHVVHPRQVDDRKAVFATVESADQTLARARIGGTVGSLTVDEGSQVETGQTIAVVGDPKLVLELAAIDQRLRSLEARKDLAALELQRTTELRRSGAATQARVDDAKTALEVASRAVEAMKKDRQVVAERLSEGAVLAPGAGRVLKVHVTEGSVVLPGESIATIASENYLLRMMLPERHARFLKVGDVVRVGERGLSGDDGALRQGIVRQVYPQVENGRVVADVEVSGLGDYFVGERVKVFVSAGGRRSFVVPADYVYRRFGVDFVRLKDGTEVVVQAGEPTEGGIEILSGLRDGDVLVQP